MAVETLTLVKGKDKLELPQQNGNWVLARELGYSPVQMLVTAAAACGGYVYTSVLENSHVPAEIEKIEVSYTRDSTKKAEPISSIQINFYADFSGISRKSHSLSQTRFSELSSHPIIRSNDHGSRNSSFHLIQTTQNTLNKKAASQKKFD